MINSSCWARFQLPLLLLQPKTKTLEGITDQGFFIFRGPERIRTAVRAFAELCLATRPQDLIYYFFVRAFTALSLSASGGHRTVLILTGFKNTKFQQTTIIFFQRQPNTPLSRRGINSYYISLSTFLMYSDPDIHLHTSNPLFRYCIQKQPRILNIFCLTFTPQ